MGKQRPSYTKGMGNADKWVADHRSMERKCLNCQKLFFSFHAGNRICDNCSKLDSFIDCQNGLTTHSIGGTQRQKK